MRAFFVLALVASSAFAQEISTNTTWSGTVNLDRDVRVDPGVTLTVSPGTTITRHHHRRGQPGHQQQPGGTQQFSATGKDAFGNSVAGSVTWTANLNAGAITAGGLFTAGAMAGDYPDGVTDADAGTDAGTGADGGMMGTDGGSMVVPDGRTGNIRSTTSGCGCAQVDPLMPLLALVGLALRRRRVRG